MKNFKLITFYIIFLIVGCEDTNQNDENKNEIIDEQPTIPCLKANLDCQRTIELIDEQTFTFDLFSTHPLDSVMQVKNAIIFIHGRERNSNEYFKTMVSAIESLGQTENVVVIAPKFKNEEDVYKDSDIYWSYLGWRYGNNSQPSSNATRHSSFAVIDTLVTKLASKTHFPKMEKIIAFLTSITLSRGCVEKRSKVKVCSSVSSIVRWQSRLAFKHGIVGCSSIISLLPSSF